jgi:hypothetical protein
MINEQRQFYIAGVRGLRPQPLNFAPQLSSVGRRINESSESELGGKLLEQLGGGDGEFAGDMQRWIQGDAEPLMAIAGVIGVSLFN